MTDVKTGNLVIVGILGGSVPLKTSQGDLAYVVTIDAMVV